MRLGENRFGNSEHGYLTTRMHGRTNKLGRLSAPTSNSCSFMDVSRHHLIPGQPSFVIAMLFDTCMCNVPIFICYVRVSRKLPRTPLFPNKIGKTSLKQTKVHSITDVMQSWFLLFRTKMLLLPRRLDLTISLVRKQARLNQKKKI